LEDHKYNHTVPIQLRVTSATTILNERQTTKTQSNTTCCK